MATTDPTVNVNPVVNPIQYEGQAITQIVDITGPVSYSTGGFSFGGGSNGLIVGTIRHVELELMLKSDVSAVRLAVWNPTTQKIAVFIPNTGAEVAAAVDLSTFVARAKVSGY